MLVKKNIKKNYVLSKWVAIHVNRGSVLIALLQMPQRLPVHLYKSLKVLVIPTKVYQTMERFFFFNSRDTRTHLVNVTIIVTFSLLTRTKLE
jgi:hypothetical protein